MQSETIGALAAALAKAQGAIKPATKDNTVKTNTYNYSYATLAQLWEVAREALSANGLAVTQTTDIGDSGDIILLTTLMHTSGEWVGGVYPVRAKDNMPQSLGSAMTYARRYALSAMLGLTADDDDDGNAASAPAPNRAPVKAQNGGAQPKPAMPVVEQPNLRSDSISDNGHGTGNGKAKVHAHDETVNSPLPAGVPSFVADWQNVDDAFAWAIQVGACRDTYHARGSMKKVVDGQFGGKFTTANRLAVFVAFWQRQTDKLNGVAQDDNPFMDEAQAVPA